MSPQISVQRKKPFLESPSQTGQFCCTPVLPAVPIPHAGVWGFLSFCRKAVELIESTLLLQAQASYHNLNVLCCQLKQPSAGTLLAYFNYERTQFNLIFTVKAKCEITQLSSSLKLNCIISQFDRESTHPANGQQRLAEGRKLVKPLQLNHVNERFNLMCFIAYLQP